MLIGGHGRVRVGLTDYQEMLGKTLFSCLLRETEEPECDNTFGLFFGVLFFLVWGPEFSASPNDLKRIKIDTNIKM